MIEVASDDLYERDPHAILETFLLYQPRPASRACRRARCARCTTPAA
jgi:UTP:GlnB (protein PII) uridylyltransferase